MNGINLAQIGFIRYDVPCVPLLLKTLFTLTFWITLREAIYESRVDKQSAKNLTATFHDTVDGGTTADPAPQSDKKSKFVEMTGNVFNVIFLQLWIWIVLLVLFLCAITGEKMTTFRIGYMTLVLVFLITFQVRCDL